MSHWFRMRNEVTAKAKIQLPPAPPTTFIPLNPSYLVKWTLRSFLCPLNSQDALCVCSLCEECTILFFISDTLPPDLCTSSQTVNCFSYSFSIFTSLTQTFITDSGFKLRP
jgi:hypothetical protein